MPYDIAAKIYDETNGFGYLRRPDTAVAVEAADTILHLRFAWLSIIQGENSCTITGYPCGAKRCGCEAEQDLLLKEFRP